MAGEEKECKERQGKEEGFVWDAHSNLFYHAGTGFYHDPIAGWYYSTTDGLYYTFQDGNYVLLQSNLDEGSNEPDPSQVNECSEETSLCEENNPESFSRPSEWLDEILINQYLSGYPKPQTNPDDPSTDAQTVVLSSEEESWLAQYGQVERQPLSGNDVNNTSPSTEINAVDLWDWELVKEASSKEGQNRKIAKLTGRLVGQSSKLHPSLPCSAAFVKNVAVRQTHLDLVRVSSGKVYRLRTPSRKYLATLKAYDSSNPTKDWGFPPLSTDSQFQLENITVDSKNDSLSNLDQNSNNEEKQVYRDRAAERRRLHGINGIAPRQKGINYNNDDDKMDLESDPASAQEEARQMAFGTGSYARKIMQNMGWKDGEALGGSQKGIVEPLQALGNKGQAGLGWQN